MTAEPMAMVDAMIGKDGKLARRRVEPGEFQSGITRGTFRRLHRQGGGVAAGEILAQRRATGRRLDQHETPRLAQPDRRRETGQADQPLDRAVGQALAAEVPDVATPGQQRA